MKLLFLSAELKMVPGKIKGTHKTVVMKPGNTAIRNDGKNSAEQPYFSMDQFIAFQRAENKKNDTDNPITRVLRPKRSKAPVHKSARKTRTYLKEIATEVKSTINRHHESMIIGTQSHEDMLNTMTPAKRRHLKRLEKYWDRASFMAVEA